MTSRCGTCGGPLTGQEPILLCLKCRQHAPQRIDTEHVVRRRPPPDPYRTHEIVFTDDEMAVRDE
jgi:hypothetical protein